MPRECRICHQLKDDDQYAAYQHTCRSCCIDKLRQWKATHPLQARASRAYNRYKHKYGITRQQYQQLLAGQGGRCKLCDRSAEQYGRMLIPVGMLGVTTLLCQSCHMRYQRRVLQPSLRRLGLLPDN